MICLRLPRHVSRFKDRHGRWRYRFRRTGYPTVYLKSEPGTSEFHHEIAAIKPAQHYSQAGTFDDLIARYYNSPRWSGNERTLRVYRNLIERFRSKHGHRLVSDASPVAIDLVLSEFASAPTVANRMRKLLIALFDYSIKLEMRKDNPALSADRYKVDSKGFHAWTDADMATFTARWPVGTKPRLAFAMLLYTAQRRSDVIRITPEDVAGDRIALVQQKTGKPMVLPIHPALREALDAGPMGIRTVLESERGPFTSASFGNWFRKQCDAAGLKHCSAHGLRKAMARMIAEKGGTNAMMKGFGGWSKDDEVSLYTKSVDQETMAVAALKILLEGD